MTLMEESRDQQVAEYERVLGTIKAEGGTTTMAEHPGAKYLAIGYAEGFGHGYKTSSGAAHAGLSVTIGAIDAGVIDLATAKEQLIELRNAIKEAAGL